jgi:hypothetical protein
MDLAGIRRLLRAGKIELEIRTHAAVEAKKDGLEESDLRRTVWQGEKIADYGERALLLDFTTEADIPVHIVLEYFTGDAVALIVTAYVPDSRRWKNDWKTRKETSAQRKRK